MLKFGQDHQTIAVQSEYIMCYSAQLVADFKRFTRQYGVKIAFEDFVDLYLYHSTDSRPKTPRALDVAFTAADGPAGAAIQEAVRRWDQLEMQELEDLVFAQRVRLVSAEQALQKKVTKKAENDQCRRPSTSETCSA